MIGSLVVVELLVGVDFVVGTKSIRGVLLNAVVSLILIQLLKCLILGISAVVANPRVCLVCDLVFWLISNRPIFSLRGFGSTTRPN